MHNFIRLPPPLFIVTFDILSVNRISFFIHTFQSLFTLPIKKNRLHNFFIANGSRRILLTHFLIQDMKNIQLISKSAVT